MADITPNDIINKKYRLAFRGYATDEVDEFMQGVSDSLFRALEDNQRLQALLEEMNGRLQHYVKTEELIKNALVLAERTADETRRQARDEADLLQRETREALRAEYAELEKVRQERMRMLAELRAVLQAHLTMIEAQERQMTTRAEEGSHGV